MLEDERTREVKLLHESFYSLRLKEWALQIPLIKLSRQWEKNILDLVPRDLLKRHPRRVESTLREIRDIYENDMRNFAICSIIPSQSADDSNLQQKKRSFDFLIEDKFATLQCNGIAMQRVRFASKYFLSHSIMRHIIDTANGVLPRVIVDLKDYRKADLFDMSELRESINLNIKRCSLTIENDYYREIVRVIAVNSGITRSSERKKFAKLLNCATNLFAQQIVKIMMNTIDELIELLADYRRQSCPRLSFKLMWKDNSLAIEPSIDRVYSMWHSLVDSIESVANRLSRFEYATVNSANDRSEVRIKIGLPEWYVKKNHKRIDDIMSNIVGPLEQYYDSTVQQFGAVTSVEMRENIADLISRGRNFDVYCSNVKKLNEYYERSNEMTDSQDYDIGTLFQSEAKLRLKAHIVEMRDALVEKLLINHCDYNLKICKEFEDLRDRMLDIPNDAQSLFQLSETISCASRVLVEKLEMRVKKSIEMLSSVISITSEMSEEHVKLNSTTINWLAEIQPVFIKSNTLCEAMKSELEDELQRQINKLNTEIETIVPQFQILDDMDDAARVDEYAEYLSILVDHLNDLDRQIERINFEERLFKFPETSFPNVEDIRNILMPVDTLNGLMCEWRRDNSVWLDGPFEYIDADHVRSKTLNYREEFNRLNTNLKSKIKIEMQSSSTGKPFKFSGVVDDPDPMQQPAPLKLCWQVIQDVERFNEYIELIVCMCNPALCDRHWEEMSLIYNGDESFEDDPPIDKLITPNAGTTLRKLIALDLNRDIAKYQMISVGANKELALSRRLEHMIGQWERIDFNIIEIASSDSSSMSSKEEKSRRQNPSNFEHLEQINVLMEEHFVVIREMKVSYFVKPIAKALGKFSLALERVEELIQWWLNVQDQWFDLEPVFRSTSENVDQEELRGVDNLFLQVYESLQSIKGDIIDDPRFQSIADKSSKFFKQLRYADENLELIRETVGNYLRRVRSDYPRFYFLSDSQAMRIIFEPQFSRRIRLLMTHCFDGISSVRLGDAPVSAGVVSIIDKNDQKLSLITKSLPTRSSTPAARDTTISSFIAVEKAIRKAVRNSISESLGDFDEEKILQNPDSLILMSAICGSSIHWTGSIEEAYLSLDPLAKLISHREKQSSLLNSMIKELRHRVLRKRRKILVALIVQARRQLDITRLLTTGDTRNTESLPLNRQDFNWKAQIRHYWRENDVKVVILDTESSYGYEYSVGDQQIIDTPLTDRCYRSLMEAHRNRLCGALFGPPASAKTQCIKSLARTLAIPFRVFNCHEKVTSYSYIDNSLKGLVGCSPCWLCFEHLDLLTIEVQSVLAQRICELSQILASSDGSNILEFQGTRLFLRDQNCCFISSTISSIYPNKSTGESTPRELTDSLKTLFRPVAMMIPDRRRIIEVQLFAEGFVDAAILSEKIHLLENYSIDQLTSARSYDFSTRTTVCVVRTACALKNRYPEAAEESLILRAILDVHLPKFARCDVIVFQNIIEDLFPGVELPPPNYAQLLSAVKQIRCDKSPAGRFYSLKIIQMFEMIFMRHAIIIVGPALAGKTSIIDTLAASLALFNEPKEWKHQDKKGMERITDADRLPAVESVRINHVSLSSEEFLGRYEINDAGKVNWRDGILTRNLRRFAESQKHACWQWLILDGPLDQFFQEKLNTLLDDDATLFLTSGECIRMTDSMSVIIETSSIDQSSPATISRCGVIYVEEETIRVKGRIEYWISEHRELFPQDKNVQSDDESKYLPFLESLMQWSLEACINFVYENLSCSITRLAMMTNRNHMAVSVLRLFEMFLRDAMGEKGEPETRVEVASPNRRSFERSKCSISQLFGWSQAALLMAIVWGIGGALDRKSRQTLDEFCTSLWRSNSEAFSHREIMKKYELPLPNEGLIQDHIYVFAAAGSWRNWSDVMKKDTGKWLMDLQPGSINYVPTVESLKYVNLFETHLKYRKPFIVLGETASGKTLYMRYLLKKKICQTSCLSNFITLGATGSGYSGQRAQQIFLSRITKLKTGLYGPGASRLSINFIDDLNVCRSANSEDEAALELIRQYYDSDIWYQVDSGDEIRLSNVMFLAALSQDRSNDWRNANKWRETRFFRHFSLYSVEQPSTESIFKIYSNIFLANLRANMFNADVSASVNSIVNATIDVYSSVVQKLKPIPSKFQYQFGPRDISRVINGCSLIHKDSVETKITLVKLWVHETLRVFADRIVDPEDADWLFVTIRESVKSHFKDSFETIFDNLPKNNNDELTRESFQQLIFSDFMQADTLDGEHVQTQLSSGRKRYEEVVCSREALRNKAISYLKRYNDLEVDDARKLDILILSGLLEHLLRISRILGTPGGSLLMICFGGSGRRSLTALAAHLRGQRFQELSCRVSSGELVDPWKADVKEACMSCISDTSGLTVIRDCTFFVTERQIFGTGSTDILGDICNLMKTGQVPNLFNDEERDEIVEKSRLMAQKGDRNLEISSLSVIDFFHNKCQEKLHFVLYFNGNFTNGARNDARTTTIFNSIVSHCSIDYYEFWPDEAFTEIATKFMTDIDIDRNVKSRAIVASKYFYDSVENNWGFNEKRNSADESNEKNSFKKRLPVAAYVHMVKLYGLLMLKRQNEIRATRKRYLTGLEKLELAGDQVRQMQATLTSLKPQLEQSAKVASDTMKKIESENSGVETATFQVIREEQVANRIAEVAGILKEECEAELAVAIPILEDAVAALNTLKPTDITLVKAMKNPPDTVKLVLAAVCVMLNVPPDRSVDPVTGKKSIDYWAPSKRILGDMNFLQNLKDYDKDNIPPAIMSVVNKTYMTDENFRPHIVVKASSAAEGLCKWVRAMVSYDEIAKVVAPKKEKLATAEKECNASLEYLNEKRKSLEALNDRLTALNVVLEETLGKKLQLENQVANCTNKLAKAEGLIQSLAGEKSKWLKSSANLQQSYDFLAGDLLLSCGLVAFLGVMPANEREVSLVQWKKYLRDVSIPNSSDFYDFVNSLEMELQISKWHNYGLTNNKLSDGNAVIVNNSLLWPFFLDPQNQATLWIKKMETSNKLRVIKATNAKWLGEIEKCVRADVPVLLENLEQSRYLETTAMDYLLLNLCRRHKNISLKKNGDGEENRGRSNFRLYMTSRVSSQEARFGPHIYKLTSVINFTLADEALENRLLEIVVSRERPELQDKFERSMAESATNKKVLREEEDNILSILSSSTVNIVEDERAIATLDYSKNLSLEIMRKEQKARATTHEMMQFRDNYRPLTSYCAALYDTLGSLTCLNHMYRFSLDWFTRLYVRSIDRSMKSIFIDKRLTYLKASFTETLHDSVRNALLDEHKLVYSFILSTKTLIDAKKITREDIRVFRETAALRSQHNSESESTITDDKRIIAIGEKLSELLPIFHDLPDSFRRNAADWRAYCESSEKNNLPVPWNDRLTDFQKLIFVSSIKPERTISMIINIVENSLETKLHSLTRYSIVHSYDESSCLIPLLFILPSYLDVYRIVARWARKIGYSSRVTRFSLGACRDPDSRDTIGRCIATARKYGGWVLLEDCHLASDESLGDLEKICETLEPSNTVLTFRLWLTSYPSTRFPISVAQNSIKIHWKAPSDGVKESFLRYYQSEPLDDPNFYNVCPGKNKIFAKLVYALCFFHTAVRARDTFGKRGWNVGSYEFTDLDLKISIGQLAMFLNETVDDFPKSLDCLIYLTGECYYGGRILDSLDRRLLNTILHDYCNNPLVRATSSYVFAIDRNGQRYSVPNRSEYHDFVNHINKTIPIGDSPAEIFSLDDNAATVRDERKATNFLNSLSLLFSDDSANGSYADNSTSHLSTIVRHIRDKLGLDDESRELDIVDAKKIYPFHYSKPLDCLLIEEIEIYNNLMNIIRDSIVDIERTYDEGLDPLFLTFTAIDRLVENFVDNLIPLEWNCISNESKQCCSQQGKRTLSQFIDYLPKRKHFLDHWIKRGHDGTNFWLGGIVRCKKFISSCRIMLARKCDISLSQLDIKYEILKIDKNLPSDIGSADDADVASCESGKPEVTTAVRIDGLFLSGARWDVERSTLVESMSKVHWDRMPTIRLTPCFRSKPNTARIDDENSSMDRKHARYLCPVKTSRTTETNCAFFDSSLINYIATVPLDSHDMPPEYWIKRTTALFCNKDD